mmetsp:Transcript_42149/g.106077  ORF Transcript_42149/g.106077 Transcript_42149/m.106077 type:complete len:329 (-) Transcript_42149:26-1012(-)
MGAVCCHRRRQAEEEKPFWETGATKEAASEEVAESLPVWMEKNQEAEIALKQADEMFKIFLDAIAKATDDPSAQDPEAMKEAWVSLAQCRTIYAVCAELFEAAAANLDAEMDALTAQGKRTDVQVPEALVSFRASLGAKIKNVSEAQARIYTIFEASEKAQTADDSADGAKDEQSGEADAGVGDEGGSADTASPAWMVANQAAESTLQQAEAMFQGFLQLIAAAQAGEAEPNAEIWTCLVGAKTLYAKGACHLQESAEKLDEDVKEMLDKAKNDENPVSVPEALAAFRLGLVKRLQVVQERLDAIEASLKAVGGDDTDTAAASAAPAE